MDTDYIAALIRRGDLGRARDVAFAVWLVAGCQIGRVVRLPVESVDKNVWDLVRLLGCSSRQAERLLGDALRYGLVERIGKSELRASPATRWRRDRMSIPTQNGGKTPPFPDVVTPTPNGGELRHPAAVNSDAERRYFPDAQRRGPMAETARRSTAETAALGGFPPHTPPSVRTDKDLEDKQPATAENASGLHGPAVCLSNSEGNVNDNDERPRRKAFAVARQACQRWNLPNPDANGIASAILQLEHPSKDQLGAIDSAANLIAECTAEITSGAQLVGYIRNRWAEYVQPGGALPDASDVLDNKHAAGPPSDDERQRSEDTIARIRKEQKLDDIPLPDEPDNTKHPDAKLAKPMTPIGQVAKLLHQRKKRDAGT